MAEVSQEANYQRQEQKQHTAPLRSQGGEIATPLAVLTARLFVLKGAVRKQHLTRQNTQLRTYKQSTKNTQIVLVYSYRISYHIHIATEYTDTIRFGED